MGARGRQGRHESTASDALAERLLVVAAAAAAVAAAVSTTRPIVRCGRGRRRERRIGDDGGIRIDRGDGWRQFIPRDRRTLASVRTAASFEAPRFLLLGAVFQIHFALSFSEGSFAVRHKGDTLACRDCGITRQTGKASSARDLRELHQVAVRTRQLDRFGGGPPRSIWRLGVRSTHPRPPRLAALRSSR